VTRSKQEMRAHFARVGISTVPHWQRTNLASPALSVPGQRHRCSSGWPYYFWHNRLMPLYLIPLRSGEDWATPVSRYRPLPYSLRHWPIGESWHQNSCQRWGCTWKNQGNSCSKAWR